MNITAVESLILAGWQAAFDVSPATLSYLSGSTTVSASVVSSYGAGHKYQMNENNFIKEYLDYSVLAKTSDVSSWGLEPLKSKVVVDGTTYLVGGLITKNKLIYQITLRNSPNQ